MSKAFDCLDHGLLIAKLKTNGFNLSALNLIHDYLSYIKERVRANASSRELLIIHIHDDIDIANFSKNVEDVIEPLERASVFLFRWFEKNLLKGNADKCYFLVSTSQEVSLNINSFKIKKTVTAKIF